MVRHFLLLSGGEFVSKLIGFVAFAYLARALEPSAYGAVELAVSLSLFFAVVVEAGLSPIGAREVARDARRAPQLAGEIPSARFLVAALAIPGMCGLVLLLDQPPAVVHLVWVFSLGLLAVPLHQHWLFQGLEMMEWVSLAQIVRMSAFAIGIVIAVQSPGDLPWVGAVELGAALTLAAYFCIVQGRRITPLRLSMNLAGPKRLLREGLSVGLSQIVWALNQYLPTLLIAFLMGSVEVAFFGSAHRVVMSLATFSWLYHFNLFPAVSKALAESKEAYRKLVGPSFKATAWGGIGIALLVTLLSDSICRFVYGDAFSLAGTTLAVLVWTIPLTLFSGHARWALIARGEQRFVLVAQIAGAITTVSAGWWAMAQWGALGGAIAMVSSSLIVSDWRSAGFRDPRTAPGLAPDRGFAQPGQRQGRRRSGSGAAT
jgi:O-antigen/teichoic acid export membrane protein